MSDLLQKTVLNGLYFSGIQAISSFWTGGIGGILMLHHVRDDAVSKFSPNRHLQITPKFLDKLLGELSKSGCEFVSLDTLHEHMSGSNIERHRKLIAITLDDGYRDNMQFAAPVFSKHNAPYTIFVAPGMVDGRADIWWEDLSAIIAERDEIRVALPRGKVEFDTSTLELKNSVFEEVIHWLTHDVSENDQRDIVRELAWNYKIDTGAHRESQIMTWKEIKKISSDPLCTIGAHTIHHYAVARLTREEAAWEMRESARILKAELGYQPLHFAYPYGYPLAAGARDFELAKELGFKTAVTTRHGVLHRDHANHFHALPRISLNGKFQSVRYVETLLSGLPTLMQNKGRRINIR